MEFLVVGSPVFDSAGSFIPGLVLVVIATVRILLGYLAEERAKRVRMERLEEPSAPAPHPTRADAFSSGEELRIRTVRGTLFPSKTTSTAPPKAP